MKNTLKIYSFSLLLVMFSCKAQQTYPLNTYPDDVASYSYMKDYNNELDAFVGIWKGTFEGRNTTLYITKEIKKLFDYRNNTKYYKDVLIIKYKVVNTNGIILQDTTNQTTSLRNNMYSTFTNPSKNSVYINYSGTNCGVGWGSIELKKMSSTQLLWQYRSNSTILTEQNCPGSQDTNIYIPGSGMEDVIFTKQ